MNNNEKFIKYKRIKNDITYNYKGYPIEKIIAIDLIVSVYIKRNYTLKSFLSSIIKGDIPTYLLSLRLNSLKIEEPTKTLFSMGINNRKDYYEIWEFAKSHVKSRISFDFFKQQKYLKFNLRTVILSWKIINKTKELSILSKFKLAAKISYYLNIIDDLEKIKPLVQKYCAFNSVLEHEAILTSYFQKNSIPTYSLQHGLYTVYNDNIPLDAILYENFNTDYHLCWGSSTKDEFVKYGIDKDALVVAGYPRVLKRPSVPASLRKKECLVLLARYSYQKANLQLIEILKDFADRYKVHFHLKLHPSLHSGEYWPVYKSIAKENEWTISSKETTVLELLQNAQFGWAISVNTSAYYESYLYYTPCLRYNDGTFEDMTDIMQDTFSNAKELEFRFNSISFDDSENLNIYFNEINKKLDYAIGIGKNEYNLLSN